MSHSELGEFKKRAMEALGLRPEFVLHENTKYEEWVKNISGAMRQIASDCMAIAQSQANDIGQELPDGHGGDWAKKFGRNVALSIAGAIKTKFGL